MGRTVIAAVVLALVISTDRVAAQQPQRSPRDTGTQGMMMKDMQQHMRMMDSANARLDTLVRRMNRASGDAKVAAMAQVINELVTQRRAMQAHMRQMMQSHRRMMGGEMMMRHDADTVRHPAGKPNPEQTTGLDTAGHGQHHSQSQEP
jgi:hypothetical protein